MAVFYAVPLAVRRTAVQGLKSMLGPVASLGFRLDFGGGGGRGWQRAPADADRTYFSAARRPRPGSVSGLGGRAARSVRIAGVLPSFPARLELCHGRWKAAGSGRGVRTFSSAPPALPLQQHSKVQRTGDRAEETLQPHGFQANRGGA